MNEVVHRGRISVKEDSYPILDTVSKQDCRSRKDRLPDIPTENRYLLEFRSSLFDARSIQKT